MSNKNKDRKRNRSNFLNNLRAKLSLDDGFAERPIYSIKGRTTEKDKGISMLELIEDQFNISKEDREKAFRKKMNDFNDLAMQPTEYPKGFEPEKIKFTRDSKGNLASPFRTKKE